MSNSNDLAVHISKFLQEVRSIDASDDLRKEIILKGVEIYAKEILNRDVVNWGRVRAIIEHENTLINHRMTWLLSTQGASLAIFGVLIRFIQDVSLESIVKIATYGIPILGMTICFNIYISLKKAQIQIDRTTAWWYNRPKILQEENSENDDHLDLYLMPQKIFINKMRREHPPLHHWQNIEDLFEGDDLSVYKFTMKITRIEFIPWIFLFIWISLVTGLLCRDYEIWPTIKGNILPSIPSALGWISLGVFGCFIFLTKIFNSKRKY